MKHVRPAKVASADPAAGFLRSARKVSARHTICAGSQLRHLFAALGSRLRGVGLAEHAAGGRLRPNFRFVAFAEHGGKLVLQLALGTCVELGADLAARVLFGQGRGTLQDLGLARGKGRLSP
jgi:hypothetical protein